ncbi:MAG: 16S rRNA (cytosine(1402)-N(4))-methyltransferase RsmH [Lachnospiraceae bacterium]|nr:16S rRNA (cytosine(1402)-N(4))-methyltransferase RsmH [Lachnospiraceae bacterium]MBR4795142.1 16S rRNA (cytosine(1402)-N(4))-methyltransferase RsmH [Lachnospiraceae bacterium]
MEFNHVSVLLNETIESLNIKPDGIYVDGTLGGAGHSFEICKLLSNEGKLIGIDQDEDAINAATLKLMPYNERAIIIRDNYKNLVTRVKELGIESVNGILLDIGVSSFQLDTKERGFSYMEKDAPLDMRMDNRNPLTAEIIVNEYDENEIFKIIRDYGEDKFAKNIAKHIVNERSKGRIKTTGELAEIVRHAIPKKFWIDGPNPAMRTFQALRIECNRELEVLTESIDGMIDFLAPGGRLAIITFHSLEDRIVKEAFRRNENPCTCPKDFPVCVCGKKSKGHVVTKKPITPSAEELEVNSRSHSAKLRVFEKLG